MQPTDTYLGLGANLGDPVAQVRRAVDELLGRRLLEPPVRRSSLYRTPPWGLTAQPWFVNAVVSGRSPLPPLELLRAVKQIEKDLGRSSDEIRWGPRLIDIDILLYGRQSLSTPELTLPHPQMRRRAFVLVPLLEIAPDLLDPVTGEPYNACLDSLAAELQAIERMPASWEQE